MWKNGRSRWQTESQVYTGHSQLGAWPELLVAKVRPEQGWDLHYKEVWFLEGTPVARVRGSAGSGGLLQQDLYLNWCNLFLIFHT